MSTSLKVSIASLAAAIVVSGPAYADYVITQEKSFPSITFIEFDPTEEPVVVAAPQDDGSLDKTVTFSFPEEPTPSTGLPALIEGAQKTVGPMADRIMSQGQPSGPAENVEQRVEERVSEMEKNADLQPELPPIGNQGPPPSLAGPQTAPPAGFVLRETTLR